MITFKYTSSSMTQIKWIIHFIRYRIYKIFKINNLEDGSRNGDKSVTHVYESQNVPIIYFAAYCSTQRINIYKLSWISISFYHYNVITFLHHLSAQKYLTDMLRQYWLRHNKIVDRWWLRISLKPNVTYSEYVFLLGQIFSKNNPPSHDWNSFGKHFRRNYRKTWYSLTWCYYLVTNSHLSYLFQTASLKPIPFGNFQLSAIELSGFLCAQLLLLRITCTKAYVCLLNYSYMFPTPAW